MSKYGNADEDIYSALDGANAIVLMTGHDEFKDINMQKTKELMKTPIIIDGRRMFIQTDMVELGFHYRGIGSAN